jgi:16S rRNA (uracil1498-N3)-methyltransferase
MTRRRWIADEVSSNHAALIGSHADHLIRVLRAGIGEEFDIATGATVRRGRISSLSENRVDFELGEEIPESSAPNITLLLSIFKFDRMEWAIEKCTELGVSQIIPVIARRTDAHLVSASVKRVERWRRIGLQASEQSRRTAPPEIASPLKLEEAAKLSGQVKIVLAEAERKIHLRDFDRPTEGETLLAVGPEGGWTDGELQFFADCGWRSASLGTTILRAETAAIAATAILISELG